MDRDAAIRELPTAYAVALRLRDGGHDVEAIAARLDIACEAVAPLLRMADAKLDNILAANQ
jgi:hypothetical protein